MVGLLPLRVALGACALLLVALAVRADAAAAGARPWLIAMDVAVGLAFIAAPLAAAGPVPERWLVAAVGTAWLVGSLSAWALTLHQGVLLVALVAFPTGRVAAVVRWPLIAVAVLIALQVLSQVGVAVVFGGGAAIVLVLRRRSPEAAIYPAAACATCACALSYTWWTRSVGAYAIPLVYELVLIVIAGAFPLATRTLAQSRRSLADVVLDGGKLDGPSGVQELLRGALADPGLAIDCWGEEAGRYVDAAGREPGRRAARWVLPVTAGAQPLGRVVSDAPALEDGPTRDAVLDAVRLSLANQRLRELERRRVAELEASRMRLVAAEERERERIADRLRREAGRPLAAASQQLKELARGDGVPADELIALAVQGIRATTEQLPRIVRGVPPVDVGGGRIGQALTMLASTSAPAIHVIVDVPDDVAADALTEATVYYLCSECVANAVKHSGSPSVEIRLRRSGDTLVVAVTDLGRGGADPSGTGLIGLADRAAALGGRLTVGSPPGGGTTVRVELPIAGV